MQQIVLSADTQSQGMRQPILRFAAFAILMSTSGCLSLPTEPAKDTLFDRDGIDVVLAAADRQAVMIKDPSSKERMCLAPGPDYSVTASRGVNLGVGMGLPVGPKGEQNIGGDVSRGALSLGGRNPGVLIARELMYRACELSMNLNADQVTTLQIYTRFLEAIEKIALSETGAGTASVSAMPIDPRLQPPAVIVPGQPSGPDGSPAGGAGAPATPPAPPGGSTTTMP